MAIKSYEAFKPPSPYDQERRRAEQQRRYAELLQQQALAEEEPFTYQGIRAMPSPLTALTKMLQAYGSKKALEKAEEAEQKAAEADIAGAERLRQELAPQARVAAPTNTEIAASVGMPQVGAEGDVTYGAPQQAPMRTEMVGPTAKERQNIFANYAATGTPTAQRLAQVMAAQEPKTQTMEFGDQLLNISDGMATPVMMGGKPVIAAKPAESIIGKPSPSDFTPASLAKFSQTGNFSDLDPVERPAPVTNINIASESERKDAYNLARVVSAARSINAATKAEPKAIKPGVKEATVSALPGVDEASYLAQSPQRQIVTAAQTDMIDALLTLATGAAYTKEQLAGQRAAILPRFGESKESIDAKKQRVRDLVSAARIRAGRAWTAEMDQAIETAFGPVEEETITDLPPRR